MNKSLQKALIVAPFWRIKGHVGNYRVDRFIRWLGDVGVEIVLVRAGGSDGVRDESYGVEVTIRDPLGLYRDPSPGTVSDAPRRKPNRLRRYIANYIFNPDPTIVWARRAARHPLVLQHGKGVRFVISSGPPESGHVCAAGIAERIGAELIVDMRDGWLDEPLKPLLQRSRIRRWREGRLESAILEQAETIFVTSDIWRELLEERLSFTRGKTFVLFNAYPDLELPRPPDAKPSGDRMKLLYAGRFMHSNLKRNPRYLLEPLLGGLSRSGRRGTVHLLGQLTGDDTAVVRSYMERYSESGWRIEMEKPVPREEMMRKLMEADGLLLLSVSRAAIPAKFFEYMVTGKPILAFTQRDSSVWRMGGMVRQLSTVDYGGNDDGSSVEAFLDSCVKSAMTEPPPDVFRESNLSRIFISRLMKT